MFNVTFTATGNLLRHERDLSTTTTQATSFGTFSRQYSDRAGRLRRPDPDQR